MLDTMNSETIPNLKLALEKARAAPPPAPAPASTAPATAATAAALMLAAAEKKLQAETRQCGALAYENGQLKQQKKGLQDELTTALAQVASLQASAKRPRDDQGENTEAKRPKTAETAEAAAEAQAAAAAQVAAAAAATVRADAETAATSTN
jgi:hypothetical protein